MQPQTPHHNSESTKKKTKSLVANGALWAQSKEGSFGSGKMTPEPAAADSFTLHTEQ